MTACNESLPFWLIILIYSWLLFVYDITLTSVIFSVCNFMSCLTQFFIVYILFNILVIWTSNHMNVSNIINFSVKVHNFVFPWSSAKTTYEVYYPWCLSFNRWLIRSFNIQFFQSLDQRDVVQHITRVV